MSKFLFKIISEKDVNHPHCDTWDLRYPPFAQRLVLRQILQKKMTRTKGEIS